MTWLSDNAVEQLRALVELPAPDLEQTKYRLVEQLARGGMGTVYLAEDTELGRRVALKVLNAPEFSAARLLREARIIARLEHPGIVPVHDAGTLPDGRVFYTMKFVQGSRLDEYQRGQTSLADLLRLFQKVCEAVAFAHAQRVIHRDLKPENIMVGAFGAVQVMDWGAAKILAENGPAAADPVIGTPAYMAPEQAAGATELLDQRTDVYALGATLYFLLTGQPPFDVRTAAERARLAAPPPSPRLLNPKLPKAITAVCLKALAQERATRYASVPELADEITRFLDGAAVLAYRETLPERAARWLTRQRFLVLLILAYLVMRLLALFLAGA